MPLAQLATATANQERWETVLRQWDSVNDLAAATEALRVRRETARAQLDTATQALQERRREIIEEISAEFDATVRAIGIPAITDASIDPNNYLPVINKKVFSSKNQLAGGVTTATQVAYWCSLLTVAISRTDTGTGYPAFLLLDSPRLALNTATHLAQAMYRRLTTLADSKPGRLQIIIADNELPATYRGNHTQEHRLRLRRAHHLHHHSPGTRASPTHQRRGRRRNRWLHRH